MQTMFCNGDLLTQSTQLKSDVHFVKLTLSHGVTLPVAESVQKFTHCGGLLPPGDGGGNFGYAFGNGSAPPLNGMYSGILSNILAINTVTLATTTSVTKNVMVYIYSGFIIFKHIIIV